MSNNEMVIANGASGIPVARLPSLTVALFCNTTVCMSGLVKPEYLNGNYYFISNYPIGAGVYSVDTVRVDNNETNELRTLEFQLWSQRMRTRILDLFIGRTNWSGSPIPEFYRSITELVSLPVQPLQLQSTITLQLPISTYHPPELSTDTPVRLFSK